MTVKTRKWCARRTCSTGKWAWLFALRKHITEMGLGT